MEKGLLLITKHFPFNKGETPAEMYLENEIKILCSRFEKVLVVAAEAMRGSEVTCDLPGNARCIALLQKPQRWVKLGCAARGILPVTASREKEVKDEARGIPFSKRIFLRYFANRAQQKLQLFDAAVRGGSIDPADYGVIYSYWFFDNAYFALKLCQKYQLTDAVCVSRAHGYDLYEYRNRFDYIPLRRYVLEQMDRVYACSDDGRQYLARRYPQYADKITTAFLGCADYGEQPCRHTKNALKLISCSSVIPLKRVSRIAQCAALLAKSGVRVEWTHVGGGELLGELRAFAEKPHENLKVVLTGAIPNRQLMELYRSGYFDVFVNVSETEGLPISIMEAISFGIPVIATDVGGSSEIVSHGENGLLIEKNFSDRTLVDALARIAAADAQAPDYIEMRRAARGCFEQRFQYDINIGRFLDEIFRFKEVKNR